jgi:phosphoribosylanthranilate isomerase
MTALMTGPTPLVKICGLMRNQDARFAQEAGSHYVGVVLTQGFGRSLTPGDGARVLEGVMVPRVAVTVDESAKSNVELARSIGASVIQLHGSERAGLARTLKGAGEWSIWKAIRVRNVDDVRRVVDEFDDDVDGLLVEGWREGAIGGAGLTLGLEPDELRTVMPGSLTFILAGGLTPETVAESRARYGPHVVDVSSGVERARGVKDPDRIDAFIRAARSNGETGRSASQIDSSRDHDH